MFVDAFEAILRDHATPAAARAIESGSSHAGLWAHIAEAGFLELLASEEAGGAALPLAELFPLLAALGRYATPLPVGQSIAARALLPAGAAPAGLITLAPALHRTADAGFSCPLLPYGAIADHVLADDGAELLLFACSAAVRTPTGIHGSQSASLRWPSSVAPQRFRRQGDALAAFGAALHATLLAGAMGRVFDMTLQYGNDRVQFGKSIGKFQAIQHQLGVMAEQLAAARMSAESAWRCEAAVPALLPAAIAKARTSEAAVQIAAIAHAVHGAIGVTEVYDLQLFTRRLHEWRAAHGSEDYWHPLIGRAVFAAGNPLVEFVRITVQGGR
jgi:acyl-CoA dehydrogenase